MKKKFLSLMICGAIMLSPVFISVNPVAASASSTIANAASASTRANMVVDRNFRGNNGANVNGYKTYKTVQAAIDSVPQNNRNDIIIYIKNGTYHEKITVNKPNIILAGQSKDYTRLSYNVAAGTRKGNSTYGTSGSASLTVTANAKGFAMYNLTCSNDFNESCNIKDKQAVSMKNEADESVFVNCNFIGNQDTLYANRNKQYYYNCFIGGDVDFIFGAATAYFENCYIKSYDRAGISPKGYITAPSTLASSRYGFVFQNCKLVSDVKQKGSVHLGRPWHAGLGNKVSSSVVFLNCDMGDHISSVGWTSMNTDQPKDNRMFEYGSKGPGAIKSGTRRVLSSSQAADYSKNKVLSGWNTSNKVNKLYSIKM